MSEGSGKVACGAAGFKVTALYGCMFDARCHPCEVAFIGKRKQSLVVGFRQI